MRFGGTAKTLKRAKAKGSQRHVRRKLTTFSTGKLRSRQMLKKVDAIAFRDPNVLSSHLEARVTGKDRGGGTWFLNQP